jgi:hypothetical protein
MKRMMMVGFATVIVAAGFLNGCVTTPVEPDSCLYRQEGAKPVWVESDSGVAGHYTGVGCAEKGEGEPLEQARKKALAALCDAIAVSVKSEVTLRVTDDSVKGVSTSGSRTLEQTVATRSDLNLGDISEAGRWLDPDNCLLWIRLKVDRNLVNQVITLKKTDDLYRKAMDKGISASPADRLKWIADASLILESVDFSMLPAQYGTRDLFIRRFSEARDEIASQSAQGKILFTVTGSAALGPDARKAVAERFMRGMNGKAVYRDTDRCIDEAACLEFGRSDNAAFLVAIGADTDLVRGSMGMWKATLSLSVTVSDLAKNKRLTERISESGSILTFDRNRVDWQNIVDKLFEDRKFQMVEEALKGLKG